MKEHRLISKALDLIVVSTYDASDLRPFRQNQNHVINFCKEHKVINALSPLTITAARHKV